MFWKNSVELYDSIAVMFLYSVPTDMFFLYTIGFVWGSKYNYLHTSYVVYLPQPST